MNILLWVLQISLALWNITGGFYMANNYPKLANKEALKTLPKPFWITLGVLQVLFALGLVLPGIIGMMPQLIPFSSACITLISLLGITLYTSYAGFPGMLWGLLPAILAAFIAYGRMTIN